MIIGSSPISKTYNSRKQFLKEAIAPINERWSVKMPRMRAFMRHGDCLRTATANDGKP